MAHTTERTAPKPGLAVSHSAPAGLADKTPIIFLHGIGANRRHWDDQLVYFAAQGYRSLAPDLRGFGDSEDFEGTLDFIRDFAEDVARTLDHFRIDKAHIVGLSMGGRVARWFWQQHPARTASLILANTQPGFDALGEEATEAFVQARLGPLMAGRDPAELAIDLAQGLIGPCAVPGAYDRLLAGMTALHHDSYRKTVRASVEQDRGFPLESISVPTLVIAGSDDQLYSPALAASMAGRIAGSSLKVIEHAGHLSNIEQPEAFNQTVLAFLASLG